MNLPALSSRKALILESLVIIVLALVPLFVTFPYRVNIFLSWEGAYRISEGQMPYRDFGLPLGYGYWIVPALFMKIFGPQLITLVKAQVLLNIIGGFSFRAILRNLNVAPGIHVLAVLLFVISYSFFNFWPWYNNTVIIYQLAGLAFLLYALRADARWKWFSLFAAALFTFLSFFTKQDGGGLALLLALALLAYHSIVEKRWQELAGFVGFYIVVACAFILPFVPHRFGYWFNHGQPPHSSRLSLHDIINEFLYQSQWLKFYFVAVLLVTIPALRDWKTLWRNKQQMLFLLLTLGILVEATLFQVTSYTPPDNNIFFHSFAFAYIFAVLAPILGLQTEQWKTFVLSAVLVLFWWSGAYYRYIGRIVDRVFPAENNAEAIRTGPTGENLVGRANYQFTTDTADVPVSQWVFSSLPEFHKIYMPASTKEGIDRVMALPEAKKGKDAKVLNLSELTPLDHAIGYQLETGHNIPLWHHLGVGMFNSQLHDYVEKIRNKHYDLVLYEDMPRHNNFFPWVIQDELRQHYRQVDSFLAPRRPTTSATIKVFVK
ncbi:hypothetical protein ACFOTA_19480 [Chitinophaga sp. GCM10012297]|uniref:Glycosyltransferase RgtA/B/C/D-like domain-containing protein n=1 Tax=Chitinophaga chungangae TaxID=2821488 RepID=A0ABS3YIZ0_9BACT|nr:hypothetical protein [Chitinophaga chungangae]MBO9154405.1 hypothetical protein [Chitinophaga chungangae]